MTTRVGRVPHEGDGAAFDAALDTLDALVARPPVDAAAAGPLLGTLVKTRPLDITAAQLIRLLTLCYRLSDISDGVAVIAGEGQPPGMGWSGWACDALIEASFFDDGRRTRAFIEQSADHARVLDPGEVESRCLYYRPRPNVPLHRDAAEALLAPYLAWLDARRHRQPFAHLKIAWDAVTLPLPPFEGLFWEWLDRSGEGEDMRLALALHDLRERAQQRLSWPDFEARLVPLLASDNPLIVAHAAAFIGSLYVDADARLRGDGAWDGRRILDHIAGLPRQRRTAAGAFLNGIDAMDPDAFAELARIAPDLDIADWVMSILEDRTEEPYIPGCQMFWFYLHEHYDRDPQMVMRLVEEGHFPVAWMCITENHPPAEGMTDALEVMARGPDADYAERASRLLDGLRASGPKSA